MNPTLVIMAAGIGSRYGGLKQIEPVGPHGEIVLDYSVYDAIRAGFGRVVFILRREIEKPFREILDAHFGGRIPVEIVFQDLDALPGGFVPPPDRTKPWGTGQAVWICSRSVSGPFGVINADDFYGPASFRILGDWLRGADPSAPRYALVGYRLRNTLSEHGAVARGLCEVDANRRLTRIVERLKVERTETGARTQEDGAWIPLGGDEWVSMNMWGFTPALFPELERGFLEFLPDGLRRPKSEFLVPSLVGELLEAGRAVVDLLPGAETWLGVTYPEDKPSVVEGIRRRIEAGDYPERLWA